jgi:hypothetical protein
MVAGPDGSETKNNCAAEGRQQRIAPDLRAVYSLAAAPNTSKLSTLSKRYHGTAYGRKDAQTFELSEHGHHSRSINTKISVWLTDIGSDDHICKVPYIHSTCSFILNIPVKGV